MKPNLWWSWRIIGAGMLCAACESPGGTPPFVVWPADSLEKIFRDSKPPVPSGKTLRIACARNEYEPAQLAIMAAEDIADVTLELSELESQDHTRLPADSLSWHVVGFIPLTKNTPDTVLEELIRRAPFDVPDPLREETSLSLKAGQTQPIWITARVPKNARPGLYRGQVTVKTSNGQAELPLELQVFSFALPDERHLFVTHWFDFDRIAKTHGAKPLSAEFWVLLEQYARNMAAHRQNVFITPWNMVEITRPAEGRLTFDYTDFDRFVETFLRAGVSDRIEIRHVGDGKNGWGTPIVLSQVNATDATTGKPVTLSPEEGLAPLLSDLEKHLAARGWLDRTIIHVADEPMLSTRESWRQASRFVHQAAPGLRRIDALEGTGFEPDLEVLVPKLNHLHNWFDDFKRAQTSGRELWYYTCCHPTGFYLNRFLDFSLSKVRLLHWVNWRFGVTGYLHWGLAYWGKEPFGAPRDNLPPGDTHIIYPGKHGPLNSIRWETERDGLEDYEYLWLLTQRLKEVQQRLGPAAATFDPARRADEFARSLVRDFDDFTHDPGLIHRQRIEIAREIEAAMEAPLLIVETKPMDGMRVCAGPITTEVTGVVEKGATVKVNGNDAAVANDGSFARMIFLDRGCTSITVEAALQGKKTTVRQFNLRGK